MSFQLDDLENDWTFREEYFDYIHTRHIAASIRDWKRFIEQSFLRLAPGGQLELGEHSFGKLQSDDNSIPDDCALQQYFTKVSEALPKAGIQSTLDGEAYKKLMEEAGFVDVVVQQFKMPWGPWPKKKNIKHLGAIIAETTRTGIEAYGLQAFTKILGWTEEKSKQLFADAYKDLFNPKIHSYNIQ